MSKRTRLCADALLCFVLDLCCFTSAPESTFEQNKIQRQYYDLEDRGSANDILSTVGFLVAIRDTLRLVVHGLLFAGVPCFSFIWMNRVNTGRSASRPLGDQSCPATQAPVHVLLAFAHSMYDYIFSFSFAADRNLQHSGRQATLLLQGSLFSRT